MTTAKIANADVTTGKLADDAVTPAKISIIDDIINTTDTHIMIANGSHYTNKIVSGDATLSNTGVLTIGSNKITTGKIVNDAVTYSKMQNVSADERILGRVSGADGVIEELTKSQVLTMINVEDGADVTDATNVAAAGAIMDGDFSSNGLMKRTGAGTYTVVAVDASGHPDITAASTSNNSGRTYIQDITLDDNGHITGLATATETEVKSCLLYTSDAADE